MGRVVLCNAHIENHDSLFGHVMRPQKNLETVQRPLPQIPAQAILSFRMFFAIANITSLLIANGEHIFKVYQSQR